MLFINVNEMNPLQLSSGFILFLAERNIRSTNKAP